MTKTQMTPYTVKIKNFRQGFGYYDSGLSGDLHFENKKILSFFTNGKSGEIDQVFMIEDDSYAVKMIDYLVTIGMDEFALNVEEFVLLSAEFHNLKLQVGKSISTFKNKYSIEDKLTIGALVFMDSKNSYIRDFEDSKESIIYNFNALPIVLNAEQLEEQKELAKSKEAYNDYTDVYFMKYISERQLIVEKLK